MAALSYETLNGGGNGPVVAAGLAGGLSGVADAWREQHEAKLREMLARISVGGKVEAATIRDTGQTTRQGMSDDTKKQLHDTPSGNMIASNDAAMKRLAKNIDFGQWKWQTPSANVQLQTQTQQDIHNTPSGTAQLTTRERAREHDTPSGNAQLTNSRLLYQWQNPSANTTLTNQTRFSLGNRANDIRQQGVNNQFQLGEERNDLQRRWLPQTPPNTGQTPITLPRVDFGQNAVGGGSPDEQTPPAASAVGRTPVTPMAPRATPPTGGGSQQQLDQLTKQATDTLSAYRAEQDPAKKQGLADQLHQLRSRRQALMSGGGGGGGSTSTSVSDAALDAAARVVLKTMGKQVTDANVKTFIQKNHDALVQYLQGSGGGGDDNQ